MHNKEDIKILAVIPARAGSKGIPKKNIRFLSGKPLIAYSIENALGSKYITDVVVTTDDEQVKFIAKKYNVIVVDRPTSLAGDTVTLDSVIYHVKKNLEKKEKSYDYIITLQPTSPLLKINTLDTAIEEHIKKDFDTTISAVNSPHLAWTEIENKIIPLYKERLNRQYLPKHYIETGAFVISKANVVTESTRIGAKINIAEMSSNEGIDIDNTQDWILAESELNRKNIVFRIDGYSEIGLGHIYRALTLAYNFIGHNVVFVLNKKSDIGIKKIKDSFFKYYVIENNDEFYSFIKENSIDIVVNDILDTTEEYMKKLKETNVRIINFEDVGDGRKYSDAIINALYEESLIKEDPYRNKSYYGKKYFCLKSEFIIANKKEQVEEVKEILILFGGTDNNNLTEKVLDVINDLDYDIKYTFILGLGYKKKEEFIKKVNKLNKNIEVLINVNNMAEYMERADIAISSQGRTMYELAYMLVPTIILAQNEREQLHGFGYIDNGFINLGLGKDVSKKSILSTLKWLIENKEIRKQIQTKMLDLNLEEGIKRVKGIILGENI